jgi:hypothetical protein
MVLGTSETHPFGKMSNPGLHRVPWVGWLEFSELTGFLGWWVGVSVSSLIDP